MASVASRLSQSARRRAYAHRDVLKLLGMGIACMLPGLYLLLHDQYSPLTFLLVAAAFLITYSFDLPASLAMTIGYLFLVGDVRRVVNSFAGFPKLDPLLLIGPLFTILVALPLILKARVPDALSKVILALTTVMTLEIINPRQGSVVVGFAGALFYLIPLSWYWIGRQYGSAALLARVSFRVVLPLAVVAALLGYYQTYIGVPPWQAAWVKHALDNGYSALLLGKGHIRSFGFSVNSVEYGVLLMIGSIICLAGMFSGRLIYGFLLVVLLPAIVLASMRGMILKTLLGVVIMWAVRGPTFRSWTVRLVLGVLIGFGLLGYSVKHAAPEDGAPPAAGGKASSANLATTHVTEGLAHPLDPKKSTAGLHGAMILGGFTYGLKNPLGMGLGINTIGAGKFGGETTGSSEFDISDAFITMGFVGGPLLLAAVVLGFMEAGKLILAGHRAPGYLLIGLFAAMLGSWMPLGQYAAGPFMWFCVGSLAHQTALLRQQAALDAQEDAEENAREEDAYDEQLAYLPVS